MEIDREGDAPLPALLVVPPRPSALLVLAHGAGAGMHHPFMAALSGALADEGVATLRWEFPYMAAGRRLPDRPPVALPAVAAAVRRGGEIAGDLGVPPVAGGKSFGGRMTSQAAAAGLLPGGVAGLVFVGFPLHPAKRPGTERAVHLREAPHPLLFVQGTRDRLARTELMCSVVAELAEARASSPGGGGAVQMHVEEGADHDFGVLERSGRDEDEVRRSVARAVARWIEGPGSG